MADSNSCDTSCTTTDHPARGTCKSRSMSNQLITVDEKGDTSTQSVSVPILGYSLLASCRSAACWRRWSEQPSHTWPALPPSSPSSLSCCSSLPLCAHVCACCCGKRCRGHGGGRMELRHKHWRGSTTKSLQLLLAPPPLLFLASGCRRSSFDDINTRTETTQGAPHMARRDDAL